MGCVFALVLMIAAVAEEPALPPGLGGSSDEGPALPPGLGGDDAASDADDDSTEAASWLGRFPLPLHGFFELRGGLRTQHDPVQSKDAPLGEFRWSSHIYPYRLCG